MYDVVSWLCTQLAFDVAVVPFIVRDISVALTIWTNAGLHPMVVIDAAVLGVVMASLVVLWAKTVKHLKQMCTASIEIANQCWNFGVRAARGCIGDFANTRMSS